MASVYGNLRWVTPRHPTDIPRHSTFEIGSDLVTSHAFSMGILADAPLGGHDDRRAKLSAFLESTAFPRWPGATSAKQEAVGLLRAASEVEHALLVQYIFAGYCLDPTETVLLEMFTSIASQEADRR